METLIMERNPRWLAMLRFFHENGAGRGAGLRIRQTAIAEALGCNFRTVSQYVKRMEQYDVLSVKRTTVDGSFGSPRGFNIYRLSCTPDHWEKVLAPHFIAAREEVLHRKRSVVAKNVANERRRRDLVAQAEEMGMTVTPSTGRRAPAAPRPKAEPPTPVVAPEQVEVLAAKYDEVDDDSLFGW